MSASDDARRAINDAFWPIEPTAWDGPGHPLDVIMPDGRTIAQHLDDGDVALRILRQYVVNEACDLEKWGDDWYVFDEDPTADECGVMVKTYLDDRDPKANDLLTRLGADRG